MKLIQLLTAIVLFVVSVESCGYPGAPTHSLVSFSSDVIGPNTVATYECESGFELLGPVRRTCQDNATWTPQVIPFCVLNVAVGKAPMQSSIGQGGFPQKAVDGSTSAFFTEATCTQTEVERAPWWYVNLLEPYMIQLVRVDFGRPCCPNNQPATITIRVGNNRPDARPNPICGKYTGPIEEGKPLFIPCSPPLPGAFVSIHMETPRGGVLSICEAFLYTDQALPTESCPSFRDQPLGSAATYNGRCYIFYNNQPLTFDGARRRCEVQGGSLVDETSPALQGFLSWELWRRHRNDESGQYWMGAIRDPKDPNNWKWINGNDVAISFWNLPGGNDNCSRFDGTQRWLWSDTNCNLNLNYICQFTPNRCGIPERPPNSTILATDDFTAGTLVEYLCAPGHILIGSNTRTCLPSGFYTDSVPQCKYLQCGFPTDISSGAYELVNGSRDYQSMVRYRCDDGYVLMGQETLTCDVQKEWDGPPPRCEPTTCPQPSPIHKGSFRLLDNSTTFGAILEYVCDHPGHRLIGPSRLKCGRDGLWDNEPPTCQVSSRPLYCSPPMHRAPHHQAEEKIDTETTTTTTVPPTTTTTPTVVTETLFSPQPRPDEIPKPVPDDIPPVRVQVEEETSTPSSPSSSHRPLRPLYSTTLPYTKSYFPDPDKDNAANQIPQSSTQSSTTLNVPPTTTTTRKRYLPPITTTFSRPTTQPTTTTTTTTQTTTTFRTASTTQFTRPKLMTREPEILTFTPRPSTTHFTPTRLAPQNNNNFLPLPTNERPVFTNPPPRPTTADDVHDVQPPPVRPTSSVKPSDGQGRRPEEQPPAEGEVREDARSNTRLNLGGIIALSVFGGFVLMAAVVTGIVILCRRSRGSNGSLDSNTISTNDSLSSESRGLNKYYKRAWDNLRSEAKSVSTFHTGVHRVSNVGVEGLRDTNEMTVNDATAWNTKAEQGANKERRSHQHRHHHRSESPDSVEEVPTWIHTNKQPTRRH